MARDFPESYKDTAYASLDAKTEQKLGLPSGLLSNIRERGERSNHSQVSEAAASGVYQFIPSTRKAILDKYGIDVTLSPENASEGAGLLLKEGLDRNKGDPALAVAEYHGGLNREAWGPRTKSYVNRVMTGLRGTSPEAQAATPAQPVARQAPQGSTFDRVLASMPQQGVSGPQIAQVFQAYQSGQMTPEDAAEFEADVKSGAVMLPRGASLKGGAAPQASAPSAQPLPDGVAAAYFSGQMSPEDKAQLDADVSAGLVQAPKRVELPPAVPAGVQAPEATRPIVPDTPTTFGEKVVGALETGATAVTGSTTGMLGGAGALGGAMTAAILDGSFGTPEAEKMITEHMKQGAQAMTYAPKTISGQQQTEALGELVQQAAPLTGLAGPLSQIGNAARATAQAPRAAAVTAVTRAAEAVPSPVVDAARTVATGAKQTAAAVTGPISSVTGKVRAALAPSTERRPTPGTGGSAGAAGTDVATMRRANAQDLPQPIDLTEGQATRSMEQQRFERETAKNPQIGAPLRERFEQQNEQLLQNFDAFVDQTGAQAPNLRAVGTAVDSALTKQYQADKAKVRSAYKAAEAAGELEAPVTLDSLVRHLNDSAPDAATAPVLDVARKRAIQLGIATEDADGNLVAAPVQLKTAETMRQAINRATDYEPTNVRQSTLMKLSIDEATDGLGGKLYKQARSERRRMAENYENRSVINKLLNKKRGTDDRQVALEDVFSHSILDGSLDDVRNVRRVLQRGGEEGQQAWRELQGQTLSHIRDEMTKNVARDGKGNPVVSAAALDKVVKKLDADGKLDYVFGKRGGQQLRVLNDVAKDVLVATPGAVNTSNTASVILAALDMGVSGSVGLPLPVASGLRIIANNLKDKKLAARVRESLGPATREPSKF